MKKVYATFGRLNPPTIGHELLINKVSKVASRNRADAFIFPSGSQDAKKNPLEYDEKIKYMKKYNIYINECKGNLRFAYYFAAFMNI